MDAFRCEILDALGDRYWMLSGAGYWMQDVVLFSSNAGILRFGGGLRLAIYSLHHNNLFKGVFTLKKHKESEQVSKRASKKARKKRGV